MYILKTIGKWLLILISGVIGIILIILLIIRINSSGIEEPFLDENGEVLANSISTHEDKTINGVPQRLTIRGKNTDNPVLLIVHGGPGIPIPPAVFKYFKADLEDLFTVCYWEQRGSGQAYTSEIPDSTITLDQIVDDGLEVADYLKNKFKKDKIYLEGTSWGTTVSAFMVQKNPALFHAYIGIGQMANQSVSEQMSYDFVFNAALEQNDTETIDQLKDIGRPPYPDKSNLEMVEAADIERKLLVNYAPPKQTISLSVITGVLLDNGMNFSEKIASLQNPMEYYPATRILWPTCFNSNLIRDVPEWEVPVFILQGENDHITEFSLAKDYFDAIKAPSKKWISFKNTTHGVQLEDPEKYRSIYINDILILSPIM
jgi:pimeloyl-ACP methyl ester carboxylesterase